MHVKGHISTAHFTGIGALRTGILGYFDVRRREYRRFGIDEQVEVLSLTGNIATMLVESPHYLRRTFDPATGLALLDLSPETPSPR